MQYRVGHAAVRAASERACLDRNGRNGCTVRRLWNSGRVVGARNGLVRRVSAYHIGAAGPDDRHRRSVVQERTDWQSQLHGERPRQPHGQPDTDRGTLCHGYRLGPPVRPGYHDGVAPYGFWTVEHAYADPDWLADQDDDRDYVILQVADRQQGGGAPTATL